MPNVETLVNLIKQRAFLEAGGGRRDPSEAIGRIFGNVGSGLTNFADARRKNVEAIILGEKDAREVETAVLEQEKLRQETQPDREPVSMAPGVQGPQERPLSLYQKTLLANIRSKEREKQPPPTFSPKALKAAAEGDFDALGKLFPQGVPEKLTVPSITSGRNVVTTDPDTGERILVERGTGKLIKIQGDTNRGENIPFAKLNPIEKKRVIDERKEFISDKIISDAEQRLSKATEMKSILEKNPKNSYGILAGAFTRLAGEVGRLTDEDIARNITPKDIAGRVQQSLALFKSGKFPQDRIEDMKIILDIVHKSQMKVFEDKLNNYVESASLMVPNADKESLRQIIGGRSLLYKPLSNIDELSTNQGTVEAPQVGGDLNGERIISVEPIP